LYFFVAHYIQAAIIFLALKQKKHALKAGNLHTAKGASACANAEHAMLWPGVLWPAPSTL
jgi:hypothetical protein